VPRTLLLADDSVTTRRLIELTLAGEDITVIAVNDGDEAIAALSRNPPDIVLADVGVPGRSGYDVARHVQETPVLAHIPVVLLIDAFEPIDQVRADAVGCAGVLAKPLEPRRVIGRVRELLDRRILPAAGPLPSPEPPRPASLPELERLWQESSSTAVPAPPPKPATPIEVESYFDRLDRAIAALNASSPVPVVAPAVAPVAAPLAPSLVEPPPAPALVSRSPSSPAPRWLETAVAQPALPPDEIAEQVARLVLERLTDRVVRETVGRIVPEMAERLIREEIERIKSNIK
jgi:CheY-like chemotaxis protein